MDVATAVQGTQAERLQASLKDFVAERDYFERVSNQHYEKWQAAEKRLTELENAVKHAHQSLTWCNTDQQIPAAVWYLEQVLPKATDPTEQPNEVIAE